jgi:hypothetical protein
MEPGIENQSCLEISTLRLSRCFAIRSLPRYPRGSFVGGCPSRCFAFTSLSRLRRASASSAVSSLIGLRGIINFMFY